MYPASVLVVFLVVALVLGLIPAAIAGNKGRSFVGWYIFGVLLFIIALPCAILVSADNEQIVKDSIRTGERRPCPFCAEPILSEATVCKHCGRDVPKVEAAKVVELYGQDCVEAMKSVLKNLAAAQEKHVNVYGLPYRRNVGDLGFAETSKDGVTLEITSADRNSWTGRASHRNSDAKFSIAVGTGGPNDGVPVER